MSSQKKLVELLRNASQTPSDAAFSQDVMRRVRAERPRRVQPGWWVAAAMSAAAVLLVMRPHAQTEFTMRGQSAVVTDVAVHCFSRATGAELRAGDVIGNGMTFVVDHPSATALMLFAVDSQQQVHWFYPQYVDANTDPGAVMLSGATRELLPEGVTLDRPASGALTVVALFGDDTLHVHAVETLLASQSLATAFPHATVRTLTLQVHP